jgi:hypothetical protein
MKMIKDTLTLTPEEIDQILHHTHWIAAKNGEQQRFLQKNYPGWSMAVLMKALIDAKYLVKARGHFLDTKYALALPRTIPRRRPAISIPLLGIPLVNRFN